MTVPKYIKLTFLYRNICTYMIVPKYIIMNLNVCIEMYYIELMYLNVNTEMYVPKCKYINVNIEMYVPKYM